MRFSVTSDQTVRLLAAIASVGAGGVHVAVVPDHLATWWASGLFFSMLAAFQLLWAPVVAMSQSRHVLAAAVAVNAGSAVLWTATRIWGQPVGPQAGTPLPVGPSGVIATVLEVAVVACALWALRATSERQLHGVAAAFTLGAALVAAAGLTVPGVAAALEHDHSAHTDEGEHHHGPGDSEGGHQDGSGPADTKSGSTPTDHHKPSPTEKASDPASTPDGDSHGHDGHSH